MARERKEQEQPAGCPAWLATYGDMITLVLTFFVLLYSMSSLDVSKWKALVMNLSGTNSIFDKMEMTTNDGELGLETPPEVSEEDYTSEADEWALLAEKIASSIDEYNQGKANEGQSSSGVNLTITIEVDEAEIRIRCGADIFFDTAKDVVKPEAMEIINFLMVESILPAFEEGGISRLTVEGHADVRPLSNTAVFKDNLGLSCARAAETMRYILANYDIPDGKYSVAGYGDMVPLDPANTPEAWAVNRRVEFVLVRNFMVDSQTGTAYEAP